MTWHLGCNRRKLLNTRLFLCFSDLCHTEIRGIDVALRMHGAMKNRFLLILRPKPLADMKKELQRRGTYDASAMGCPVNRRDLPARACLTSELVLKTWHLGCAGQCSTTDCRKTLSYWLGPQRKRRGT